MSTPYTRKFYDVGKDGAHRSAQVIVLRVIDLCRPHHEIKRVVDVGCGLGTWLRVWLELGASAVKSFDGDYVDRGALEIPEEAFQVVDLNLPFPMIAPADVAMSLEVAEHLPPEAAGELVHTLTSLAPVVLFSAAIPGQGGTNHVNEQWPGYWSALFAAQHYVAIDCLRHALLGNANVDWWYQQNLLIFVDQARLEAYPRLAEEYRRTGGRAPAIVHPEVLEKWKDWGIEQNKNYWSLMAETAGGSAQER